MLVLEPPMQEFLVLDVFRTCTQVTRDFVDSTGGRNRLEDGKVVKDVGRLCW
jgi:hypothetical protein